MTATLGKAANTCTRMHCMLCVRACLVVVDVEAPSVLFWQRFGQFPNFIDPWFEPSTVSVTSICALFLVSPYLGTMLNWASEVLWKTELKGLFMFCFCVIRIVTKYLRTCG